MSKKNQPSEVKPEAKLYSFYTVVQGDGGYRLVECIIDVAQNKVVEVKPPTEPDVLPITMNILQKSIREKLGL